jgi:NADH-quinone oxidoreductase subunit L
MVNLSIWVLVLPLLGFIVLGVLGKLLPRGAVMSIGIGAIALAFLCALGSFASMRGLTGEARVNDHIVYTWLSPVVTTAPLQLKVSFGLLLDQLSAIMLLVVTGVGLLIHIYSAGYMEDDPGFGRFFAFLNFFIFAMVLLVTADNFVTLLIGWGLVGLASFLLIGFWYQRRSAVAAARKAFVINVIGDVGLMLAIFLIWITFNALDYNNVFSNVHSKLAVSDATAIAVTLLIFVACAAKSAQLPLYMWLPDAMEGPTPVSALIHAATMVTAGVYLVARAHPLFEMAPVVLNVVAGIGGATALFAAVIALAQLDIKRVLAYSTISQLGYMFMSEGVHNYTAGIFHLTTHAYFKALLFLGAGAVIHALSGEQNIRKMGGLRQRMPITFWTFLIATLAISGIFPLAGFWSKDEIIGSLFAQALATNNVWFYALWGVALLTAGLTAFYMFRLFCGIFLGDFKGATTTARAHEPEDEENGGQGHHPVIHNVYDVYEVPAVMWVPLVVLGILSVVGGIVGSLAIFGLPKWIPIQHFLEFTFKDVHAEAHAPSLALQWVSVGASLLVALIGIGLAWRKYGKGFEYEENSNPVYQLVLNKFYVDEALDVVLIKPILALGRFLNWLLENWTLDGLTRGIAWFFRWVSNGLRYLQTGYMRNYALMILVGVLLIIVYIAVRG